LQIPLFRLTLYSLIPISIFSGIFFYEIILNFNKNNLYKISVLLVSILIIFSLTNGINKDAWQPWGQKHIDAANWLKNKQELSPGVIFPYGRDRVLLEYAELKNIGQNSVEVMTANSFQDIKKLIYQRYPNENKVYFFVSTRWFNSEEKIQGFTLFSNIDKIETKIFDNKQVQIFELDLTN